MTFTSYVQDFIREGFFSSHKCDSPPSYTGFYDDMNDTGIDTNIPMKTAALSTISVQATTKPRIQSNDVYATQENQLRFTTSKSTSPPPTTTTTTTTGVTSINASTLMDNCNSRWKPQDSYNLKKNTCHGARKWKTIEESDYFLVELATSWH